MDPIIEACQDPTVSGALIAALAGGGTLLAAAFGLFTAKIKRLTELASDTNAQVKNEHETNLRDDVDVITAAVTQNSKDIDRLGERMDSGIRALGHQYGELHATLLAEVKDRQALDTRVHAAIERLTSLHD